MDYETLKNQHRMDVIRRILAIYPEDDKRRSDIIEGLKAGKDFTDDLKEASYISHNEYSFLLNQKSENLVNLLNVLSKIATTIEIHDFYYKLFVDYVTSFIGFVNTKDSKILFEEHPDISLRNKAGVIDYGPYLEALGISDGRK